jgi:hypothetical protein
MQNAPGLSAAALSAGRVAASALVAWVVLLGYVWSRYRVATEPWPRFLFQGWVVFNRRLFRPEGMTTVRIVQASLVLVVVPLVIFFFTLAP